MMKRTTMVACAFVAALIATPALARSHAPSARPPAPAPAPIDPRVVAVFNAYPDGSPGLEPALVALLTEHPELYDDVRRAARQGSPFQQAAAAAAIAATSVTPEDGGSGGSGAPATDALFSGVGAFGGGGGGGLAASGRGLVSAN